MIFVASGLARQISKASSIKILYFLLYADDMTVGCEEIGSRECCTKEATHDHHFQLKTFTRDRKSWYFWRPIGSLLASKYGLQAQALQAQLPFSELRHNVKAH